MANLRYGQIGVGALGHHFALKLHQTFEALTVFDIDAERMASLEGQGIELAHSAQEVAARSDVVVLSLPNPPAVEAVMCGEHGVLAGAAAHALVIDTSSIDPPRQRDAR